MFKNKNIIALLGSTAVTILINFPRLLILLRKSQLGSQLGITLSDLILRSLVMFCFSLAVLNYNLLQIGSSPANRRVKRVGINVIILLVGVSTLVLLKRFFSPGILESRQLFFMTLFSYSTVQLILLLIVRLVKMNFQNQAALIEKEQAKQKALQHQLEALRAQINPHFLFNALNSLNALIRLKPEKASVFVDKLSWLLRSTLQRNEKDFIEIKEESEYLKAYVFLQKERFGDKLNVDIRIPEDWEKELIPSFSLQLLVENAIKHNVVSQKQPLLFEIYSEGRFLIVRNRMSMRSDAPHSTGIGLSNLSFRFKLLKTEDIQVSQNDNFFTVKLPILENESSNR